MALCLSPIACVWHRTRKLAAPFGVIAGLSLRLVWTRFVRYWRQFPHVYARVIAAGGEPRSVGAEDDALDHSGMRFDRQRRTVVARHETGRFSGGVPNSDVAVRRAAGEPLAIGAERKVQHAARVPVGSSQNLIARSRVLNLDRAVLAGRAKPCSIRAVRETVHIARMPTACEEFRARRRTPDLRRPIVATRGDPNPVRTEADVVDVAGVTVEREEFTTTFCLINSSECLGFREVQKPTE